MSIRTVKREIQKALDNDPANIGCRSGKQVDAKEADRIVKDAERGIITNGEAKLLGDLFDRQPTPIKPGMMMTMACPESPGAVGFDAKANAKFESFFETHDLPYGGNRAGFKSRIQSAIAEQGSGPELKGPPRGVKHMAHVFIRDSRPVDGNRVDAFVDARKNQIYIQTTGAGMAGPHTVGPFWSGPIQLPPKPASKVTSETKQKMLDAFNGASNLNWLSSQQGLPVGSRYERVPLKADGYPDGFTYTALVPTGAMVPGAPQKDPNKATSFFVERSGGFAGLTQVAGPIQIGATKPTAELPNGIYKLAVSAFSTFGGMAPLVQISGETNSPRYNVKLGKPEVNEATNTVSIAVSTTKKSGHGPMIAVTKPFNNLISLSELSGKTGNWTINLTNKDGETIRSTTLNQFNIF